MRSMMIAVAAVILMAGCDVRASDERKARDAKTHLFEMKRKCAEDGRKWFERKEAKGYVVFMKAAPIYGYSARLNTCLCGYYEAAQSSPLVRYSIHNVFTNQEVFSAVGQDESTGEAAGKKFSETFKSLVVE